ncbi:MAG: putative transcriptional regulator [Burkholderiales bacterium]|jgi:ATP-dependent DNA helicase RecG|nr:putative transcriptional regulator [Burkholderiales bacterium]
MNLEQISILATGGESDVVEFKKSTAGLKSACDTTSAFLNSNGGIVLFGVTDNGKIIWQEVSDKTKRDIGNELAKITPRADVEITYINMPDTNKYIIVFHVTTDSTKRPYLYDGKAFMRIQTNTIAMPREYQNELTLLHAEGALSWENAFAKNITIDNLDTKEILLTLKEGGLNGRIPNSYVTNDPWEGLQHLGLIEENKINNAGLVLFGKNPEKKYPQCVLAMARFRGINKSEFIDNKRVFGNIFVLLDRALSFLNMHLPIASTFPKGEILRKDTPFLPIVALREAIANALCHRDYSFNDGSVSLGIYDDRLEIWNYGLFPRGVSLNNLNELNKSIPRNPLIANVLYYHKICETWGRGIHMIIDECIKAGHPKPFYAQNSLGTLLTIPFKYSLGVASQVNAPTTLEHNNKKLTKRQQEILHIISKIKEGSSAEILKHMENVNLTDRTLRRVLVELEQMGYIGRVGGTRGTIWKIGS